MNKKYLMVLPLATMLLTGCGTNPYAIPKGGKAVDKTNEEELLDFAELVNEGIENTLVAAQSNVKATITIDSLKGTYDEKHDHKYYDSNEWEYGEDDKITVEKLTGKIEAVAVGLGDKVQYLEASAKIANLTGKGTYFSSEYDNDDPTDKKYNYESTVDADLKGVNVNAWLKGGAVYADLTNGNLKKAAGSIYKQVLEMEGEDTEGAEAFINQLAGKYRIDGLFEEDALDETLLDDAMVEEAIESDVGGMFAYVLTDEDMGNFIEAYTYKNGRIAAQLKADAEFFNGVFGYDDADKKFAEQVIEDYRTFGEDTDVTLTVVFDKELRLSTVGLQGHVSMRQYYNAENRSYEDINLSADGKLNIKFDWNVKQVKMPNFTEYGKFPFNF